MNSAGAVVEEKWLGQILSGRAQALLQLSALYKLTSFKAVIMVMAPFAVESSQKVLPYV